jgi:hypothetical protein
MICLATTFVPFWGLDAGNRRLGKKTSSFQQGTDCECKLPDGNFHPKYQDGTR